MNIYINVYDIRKKVLDVNCVCFNRREDKLLLYPLKIRD